MNWLIYHLGGKKRLLNKYRKQKDFHFEIKATSCEVFHDFGSYITKSYNAVVTHSGGKVTYRVGTKVSTKSDRELFSLSYGAALKCCLDEFERWMEIRKDLCYK
jgi:hypothetical protein